MNVKKLMFISAICALMVAPALAGPTVQVGYPGSGYGQYQTDRGGEFTLRPIGFDPDPLSGYASTVKNVGVSGTFQTFCLEETEYIYPYPSTFDVVVNSKAIRGGGGGGPQGDPLSVGTAWLYSEFAKGTLAGYNYTTGDRHVSARALQNTIWGLEDEISSMPSNSFTTAVINQFGGSWANAKADASDGLYGVYVLNMYGPLPGGTTLGQDQLFYSPVVPPPPVPAPGAILLGSIGVSIVGWLRRRRTL